MVEVLQCRLPPPSLADNTGDWDRLVRGLKEKGYSPIQIHPSRINHVVTRIRQGRYRVTAVLGYYFCHWELIEVFPGFEEHPALGFAIDLGTSRLLFYLLDLRRGDLLAERSVPNPQVPHGEDILTRILFARRSNNLRLLRRLLRDIFNETMHGMVQDLGGHASDVYALAIAGNTTMSHLLLGLDPSALCKEPYLPAMNRFPVFLKYTVLNSLAVRTVAVFNSPAENISVSFALE